MTITYPNGVALKAIVLSHDEQEIRAIAPGADDVLAFRCIQGTWISEEGEPVAIEFEWQGRVPSHAISEDDCICAKDLATRLIHTLLSTWEAVDSDALYVFSPEGKQFTIQRSGLTLVQGRKNMAANVD